MFALMWGVGALLELDDRAKMEEFLVKHGKLPLPEIEEGSQDTIFEFVVDDCGEYSFFNTFTPKIWKFILLTKDHTFLRWLFLRIWYYIQTMLVDNLLNFYYMSH